MDDLISRKAAIDRIESLKRERVPLTKKDKAMNYILEVAASCIYYLPSARQEIIRCKDCKHWDTSWQNDYAPNYHYCPLVDGTRRDDFYCADAERRGEQDE